jgi:type IV conjugative transfer system coupling protein TraD
MFKNLAAGGQTTAHGVRMLRQVIKIGFSISMAVGLLYFGWFLYDQPQENYKAFYYLAKSKVCMEEHVLIRAESWKEITQTPKRKTKQKSSARAEPDYGWASEDTPAYKNRMLKIKKSTAIKACEKRLQFFFGEAIEAAKTAGKISFGTFGLAMLVFLLRGRIGGKKKHLSGLPLSKPWRLKLKLNLLFKASDIKIGGVPMLKNSEAQHLLITGSSGSGKTNCLRQLLQQIRGQGDRAVIVDTTGSFVSEFYREGRDILLNPFDQRTKDWHPWCECNDLKFKKLAYGFIPSGNTQSDDFFPTAARAILEAALKNRVVANDFSMSHFLDLLLQSNSEKLLAEFGESDANIYLDPKGERTTASIRATLNNFVANLRPLKDTENPFSIRDWVSSENEGDDWLFLASSPQDREDMKTLLSVWISTALSAVKERGFDTPGKKIYLIIDELHSLQKLEYLQESLAEMRKYKGCLVLATQNLSQLDDLYGVHTAKSMIDQCGTKVCFRQSEAVIAKRMSNFFGDVQTKETQEGISYGANDMRDGVNLSSVERNRPSVSPTDILSLKNLHAYLKLPGTIPPAKVKFRYLKEQQISSPFVEDPTVLERKKQEITKMRLEAAKKKEEKNSPKEKVDV